MTLPYQERFVTINDVRLRYLDWGTKGQVGMVCMHGHSDHAHIWDEFAQAMSSHYHVLALDQRGHGESGWAKDGYARDRFVEDLEAFIDLLGFQKVVLVGLSMGGWNALLYTPNHQTLVDKIIIVDIAPERSPEALEVQATQPPHPPAFYTFEEAFTWARGRNQWATERRLRQDIANKMVQSPTGQWIWKADPALLNTPLVDNTDPNYISRYWHALETIRCPIMEVRGKESIIVSDDIVDRMKAANPQLTCIDVDNAGHVVTIDKPQEFIGIAKEFLGISK